jgi:hypothetical protein
MAEKSGAENIETLHRRGTPAARGELVELAAGQGEGEKSRDGPLPGSAILHRQPNERICGNLSNLWIKKPSADRTDFRRLRNRVTGCDCIDLEISIAKIEFSR